MSQWHWLTDSRPDSGTHNQSNGVSLLTEQNYVQIRWLFALWYLWMFIIHRRAIFCCYLMCYYWSLITETRSRESRVGVQFAVTHRHPVTELCLCCNAILISYQDIVIFQLRTAAFKTYCAILVRPSNYRHQTFSRVSPRESTQRRKVELWARNVR
jgi:hypothetical protein